MKKYIFTHKDDKKELDSFFLIICCHFKSNMTDWILVYCAMEK